MNDEDAGSLTAAPHISQDHRSLAATQARVSELHDKIAQQERIFDAIFSSISDFAYAFDRDGRFLFINQSLLDLWQMDLGDAVGKTFHELPYPEELAAKLHRQIQEVFRTGKRLTDETLYTDPDGNAGYYEYIFCPVLAPDGTVEIVAGSTRDITDRKRTEEKLRKSEEQYRNLFESIDEGFCIIEVSFEDGKAADYRFLETNPSFERQTGLMGAKGKSMRSLAPNHEEFWFETYGRIASTGEAERFEHRAGALDRYYDVYAFRVGQPEENKVGILFNDIGARKQAEEEIRKLNEHNHDILVSIGDAFFAIDREWRFTYANPQAERLLGCKPGELLGKVLWEAFPGLTGSEFEKAYRRAADERISSSVTAYYPDHDRWYEASTYPAANGITIYVRNVTERMKAEEALKESDRRKDEFLATLSHELRNPLAPIRSGLEILRNAGSDPERSARTLGMIERQTNQIIRLVDDLLDISRITQGKIRLRREHIDVRKAVEMAIETGRETIDAAGIKLIVTMPDAPVYIDADLTRTAQIFLNVLNNAAKFSFPDDRINVTVEVQDPDVVITVKDSGRGIAAESLPKIFEMFGQIEPPENRELGGLGIGLSIVKQLTEMHGGSVSVSSEGIGHGSEFVIRLPLAADQSAPESVSSTDAPAPSRSSGQKILVVDDNRDAAEMLETLLSLQGYEVAVSFESTRAVDVARDFAPSVCLLDIGMPEMDGYDLARQLRKILPGVLLISVSGWGQEQDRIRSHEAGFDHHFVKPVEFNSLLDVIAEHGEPGRT